MNESLEYYTYGSIPPESDLYIITSFLQYRAYDLTEYPFCFQDKLLNKLNGKYAEVASTPEEEVSILTFAFTKN